ncbi:MAG: 6-bladed beta-propeller [Tannerellaceae bacterium]|jgi:hypothetical protein|nr:6-bladed beta-propeller [Tannerellaceae bacterium]
MKTHLFVLFIFTINALHAQQIINIEKNITKGEDINLSFIAKSVRYIPLETNRTVLLSDELQVYHTTDYIFIGDQQTNLFYRFDKDGKFMNTIGKKGGGPGEYAQALFFFIDENLNDFYIIGTQEKALYVYDFSGKFKRKIELTESPWAINKSGENFVFYNNRFNRIKNANNINELFLADKNGKLVQSTPTSIKDEELDMMLFELPFFYTYNNRLFYKNPLIDKVFQIDNNLNLKPVYEIRTGSKPVKPDPANLKLLAERISIRAIFENDAFRLITYTYKDDFNYQIVYKDSWKTERCGKSKSGFHDDFNNGPLFRPYWQSQSRQHVLISLLTNEDIEKQKQLFENISKKQTTLANRQTDDNPILAIAELNE